MRCNQCGSCCMVIALSITKAQARKIVEKWKKTKGCDIKSYKHILENCRRISSEKAFKKHPSLKLLIKKHKISKKYFYICRWYDSEMKLCRHYQSRPKMCSGYPFYDDMNSIPALFPECAFNKEMKRIAISKIVRILEGILDVKSKSNCSMV